MNNLVVCHVREGAPFEAWQEANERAGIPTCQSESMRCCVCGIGLTDFAVWLGRTDLYVHTRPLGSDGRNCAAELMVALGAALQSIPALKDKRDRYLEGGPL